METKNVGSRQFRHQLPYFHSTSYQKSLQRKFRKISLSLSLSLSSNLQAKFKKESFCGRILSSHLPPPCLPIQKPISTTAIPSTPLKPCLRQPDSSKLSLVLNPQKKQPKPQPFAQIPGSRKTAGADPKIKSTATDTFQTPRASWKLETAWSSTRLWEMSTNTWQNPKEWKLKMAGMRSRNRFIPQWSTWWRIVHTDESAKNKVGGISGNDSPSVRSFSARQKWCSNIIGKEEGLLKSSGS